MSVNTYVMTVKLDADTESVRKAISEATDMLIDELRKQDATIMQYCHSCIANEPYSNECGDCFSDDCVLKNALQRAKERNKG